MIKYFCDICGKIIVTDPSIDHVKVSFAGTDVHMVFRGCDGSDAHLCETCVNHLKAYIDDYIEMVAWGKKS